MARPAPSDDVCDRLIASRDPIDRACLSDERVAELSRRLRDELLAEMDRDAGSRQPAVSRRPRRTIGGGRRRTAAVVLMATAVVAGLALLVAFPVGPGHDGPLDVPVASAASVLEQAARAAIRSASVVPGPGRYGFVKVETGSVIGTGSGPTPGATASVWNAWVRMSEVKSDWYATNGSGRERIVRTSISFLTNHDRAIAAAHHMTLGQLTATFPRVNDGAFAPRALQTAGFLPYWQVGRLPTEPGALRRAFDRLILASYHGAGRGSLMRQLRSDPAGLFGPISQFLLLPTSPQLRAALFRVLAQLPGVRLLGHRRDRLGRSGIAVAVTQGSPGRVREELLFDPATSDVLQTQTVLVRNGGPSTSAGRAVPTLAPGTVVEYTDVLARGVVSSITRLPDGQRLALKPVAPGR